MNVQELSSGFCVWIAEKIKNILISTTGVKSKTFISTIENVLCTILIILKLIIWLVS